MNIPDSQIAVTLFNLREHCKTESDLDRTLDRVCEIGYKAIQLSGVSLPLEVIKKQLDAHNLFCCATHDGLDFIVNETQALIDKLKFLECDFSALGGPPAEMIFDYQKTCELCEKMADAGDALRENGLMLGYHNHHREFFKHAETGKTFLDTFYEKTVRNGEYSVFAEIDVHWVTRGGSNPALWIRKVAGRMPVVHFKDFAYLEDGPHFCEVGEGNLDWPSILEACRETNVRWYSVEQDAEFPGRDIFESIKISYDNLRKMGVK